MHYEVHDLIKYTQKHVACIVNELRHKQKVLTFECSFVSVTFVSKFNIRYVYFYLMPKLSIVYIIHFIIHASFSYSSIVIKSEFGT